MWIVDSSRWRLIFERSAVQLLSTAIHRFGWTEHSRGGWRFADSQGERQTPHPRSQSRFAFSTSYPQL